MAKAFVCDKCAQLIKNDHPWLLPDGRQFCNDCHDRLEDHDWGWDTLAEWQTKHPGSEVTVTITGKGYVHVRIEHDGIVGQDECSGGEIQATTQGALDTYFVAARAADDARRALKDNPDLASDNDLRETGT